MTRLRPAPLLLLLAALLAPQAHAQSSLYADLKAYQEGDVITVVLAERTAAQRESGWENASDSRLGGTGSVSSPTLSGRFGLDAQFDKAASNTNESVQKDLLSGTMTAMVVEQDAVGNLVIAGERTLNVNGETHLMRVAGTVRRADIRQDNTVLSYQIANANIEYKRAGGIKRSLFKPGRVVRLGALAVLAAALTIGAAN